MWVAIDVRHVDRLGFIGGGDMRRRVWLIAKYSAIVVVVLLLCCQGEDRDLREQSDVSEVPTINSGPVLPPDYSGPLQESIELTPSELEASEAATRLNAARNPEGQDPALRGFAVPPPSEEGAR
jgi:hypothetical protein